MKKNMGTVDRTIRVILALAIAVLYFMNVPRMLDMFWAMVLVTEKSMSKKVIVRFIE